MEKSADTDKPTNATDCPIFKDRYDDPISYDGNPACIPGVMHEIELHIKRTGQYQLLFEHRAVPLSNGGLAIDQADNISFIEKRYPNAPTYDFDNPCPPTDARLHEYNVMALSSTPRRTIATPTNTPVPKEQSRNYIASEHKVKEQLRSLMGSLAQCFIDRDAAHSIIEDSDGDGFKFLELWRADLKNAKPSDRALVTTKRDNAYTHGFEGELNIDSLNKFIKDFRILERRCPPESRKSDAEMMTLVNTTMLTNDSTRNAFEQLLMLSSPPIDTYDGTLKAARSMLRTRQNYVEMDAAKAKSSQFGGLPALTAAHIAALASISIDASRLPVSDAITMAESIITQNAALAAAVDPSKTVKGGKGKDKGKGKGGKGKGKGGKGKGKGASTATAPDEFVIPRDENRQSLWLDGRHVPLLVQGRRSRRRQAHLRALQVRRERQAEGLFRHRRHRRGSARRRLDRLQPADRRHRRGRQEVHGVSDVVRLHLRDAARQVGRDHSAGEHRRHHGRRGHDRGAQPLLGHERRAKGRRLHLKYHYRLPMVTGGNHRCRRHCRRTPLGRLRSSWPRCFRANERDSPRGPHISL